MVTYKDAGVDIDAGAELVKRLQKICPEIGGFGGLYPLGDQYLVASTDGVGTKLKLAFDQNRHDSIGIDLVAMCVNDIITTGAKPLFFLDYYATSQLDVDQAEQVLGGVIRGCKEAGCVLLGGETAEMPGFYQPGEYDISGFAVGVVPKEDLIDGKEITLGDLLVGIPSSGVHSNGYSLVRKILSLSGEDFREELLAPTRIYVEMIQKFQKEFHLKGISHITGGGLTENIPRMFRGMGAHLHKSNWEISPIFHWLQEVGNVSEEEMFRTFNMGIGMVLVLSPEEAKKLCAANPECQVIGEVTKDKGVIWS